MARNYQVRAEQLTEGQKIFVQGVLGFVRLRSAIEGDELAKSDARRVQNKIPAVGKPHITINLEQAQVLAQNPQQPTPEEIFVGERLFARTKAPETGMNFSLDSKSVRNLPVISVVNDDGQYVQDTETAELAQGLKVTVVLSVFKPGSYEQRGLAIDHVLVQEPVRYRQGPGVVDTSALANFGFIFAQAPQPVQPAPAPTVEEVAPANSQIVDGYALPGPGLPGAQHVQPAQVAAQPVQAPVQQAPVQQFAPAPQAAPTAIPAPVQQPVQGYATPLTPAQPPVQNPSVDQQIAQLQAQNAALLAGQGSAVTAPGAGVPGDIWDGIAQQGQQGAGISLG